MQLFLGNKSQRSVCFHCPFTTTQRQGDISLGDFWGIGRLYPDLDDDKGISMVLVNTPKGEEMFGKIKDEIDSFESDIDTSIAGNKVLVENIEGEKKRDRFYQTYVNKGLTESLAEHTVYYPTWRQYYLRFMRWGLDLIRKILHKGY